MLAMSTEKAVEKHLENFIADQRNVLESQVTKVMHSADTCPSRKGF